MYSKNDIHTIAIIWSTAINEYECFSIEIKMSKSRAAFLIQTYGNILRKKRFGEKTQFFIHLCERDAKHVLTLAIGIYAATACIMYNVYHIRLCVFGVGFYERNSLNRLNV